MIKELILAILLGAVLGFGATGGYYAYRNSQAKNSLMNATPTSIPTPIDQTQNNNTVNAQDQDPSPTDSPSSSAQTTSSNSNLTITSPENESLVNTTSITIKGTTTANSLVIIHTLKKSYTIQSDTTGKFTQPNVSLESGANLIQISAFDQNDNQSDVDLLVTYSSAKI